MGEQATASEGWRLTATSVYYGDVTIVLAEKSLHLDSKDASILITPPDYTITIFNNESHKYFSETVEDFKKRQGGDIEHDQCVVKKGKTATICGAEATQYFYYTPYKGKLRLDLEFWATKDKRIEPRMAEVCSIFCSVKPGYGMPLKILARKRGMQRITTEALEPVLDTVAVKKADVSPNMFRVPKGYKLAKSEMEVFIEEDSKHDYEDFGQMFKK
jgi:hypothetical protein